MSDHDTDILEWSEAQAALLRRAAAGERVNGLDWPHITEALRFAPSMRHRIDMADLYRRARRRMPAVVDGAAPRAVPASCPWTLDALLHED